MNKPAVDTASRFSPKLFIVLTMLLVVLAAASRLYDLTADPPGYFAKGSQDLTTDGACLTLHARSAAVRGEWDPLGYHHWQEFRISLVSGLAYLVFKLGGASLFTANLTGVLLSLGAIVLFLLALVRTCRPRTLCLIAFFLATDFLLWLFGRLPFSENALMFLIAAVFAAYTYWFERPWGKVLVGALVAGCGLLGKSYGFLVIAGPLAFLLRERKNLDWRSIALLVAPVAVAVGAYSILIPGESGLFSFIWQHAAGEHGYPYGLLSPANYLEKLVSFAYNGLFAYAPVVGVLSYLAFTRLLSSSTRNHIDRKSLYFIAGWIIVWFVVLCPFNYLPIRYLYVLLIPIGILAGLELDSFDNWRLALPSKLAWHKALGLLFLNWCLAYYIIAYNFVTSRDAVAFFHATWIAFPFGAALLLLQWLLFRKRALTITRRLQLPIVLLALAATLAVNGLHFYRWYRARTYNVYESSSQMAQTLGERAVIAGQYGPVLACNSALGGFPLFLTSDIAAFERLVALYPITHVALSISDWATLARADDQLRSASVVAKYWLRDKIVYLVRINSFTGNQKATLYDRSDYETAVDWRLDGHPDSARVYLDRFLRRNPRNKPALIEKYHLTLNLRNLMASRGLVDSIVIAYPTDFTVQVLASVYYRSLYEQTQLEGLKMASEQHMLLAIRYSPQNEEGIREACQTARPDQEVI